MAKKLYLHDHRKWTVPSWSKAFDPAIKSGLVGNLRVLADSDVWSRVALTQTPHDATHAIMHLKSSELQKCIDNGCPDVIESDQILLLVSSGALHGHPIRRNVGKHRQVVFLGKRPWLLEKQPSFLEEFVNLAFSAAWSAIADNGLLLPKLLRAVLCDPPTVARMHVKPLCSYGAVKVR